ncbi:endonuclease/exonuclease/phosphatase family protein [Jiangella anatolica]|uniref:Endonuclease/exonuclease/phosphatase domain-containing protein n=1 Tax=Jiangella anatolica TaxID=2670374 RepID=A0A2W2BKK7_9ACTN|nr:endonuclease/exonuclease/phosphatase family protein [Jiangella anatolica]PZF80838.1 hypothetical protein C1I92_24050 [Jiangella anatolica]
MPVTRILHWNIHSWRDDAGVPNVDTVAALVEETDPDVVSLVEVDEPWPRPTRLAGLAERLGYTWLFPPTVHYGDEAGPRGGYGNALLVRAPILALQQWQLRWPPRLYDGTESSEARTIVLAKLDPGVWVGSTHLPSRSEPARSAALARLLALTGELDAPWLICGDFNTSPAGWIPVDGSVQVRPWPPEPSYPTRSPAKPIDYVLASPSLPLTAAVLGRAGSDHLPLLVELAGTGPTG